VKVAIVSYDVVHPESFSLIEVLTGCFPGLRVVVIISKPTLPMILLMRGIGVDAMLSDKDDVSIFSKLILINNFRCYLSPVLYGIIKCNGFSALPDYGILTSMERFVLSELIIGGSPTSIALKKGISVKTVSAHKTKALKKIAIQRICELFFCY
jgi:two-component system capsular synthesis response regulator RcsB